VTRGDPVLNTRRYAGEYSRDSPQRSGAQELHVGVLLGVDQVDLHVPEIGILLEDRVVAVENRDERLPVPRCHRLDDDGVFGDLKGIGKPDVALSLELGFHGGPEPHRGIIESLIPYSRVLDQPHRYDRRQQQDQNAQQDDQRFALDTHDCVTPSTSR
jgi:hypothetical protein